MAMVASALVFCACLTLVVGLSWAFETRRTVSARLKAGLLLPGPHVDILRPPPPAAGFGLLLGLVSRLAVLEEQAGRRDGATDVRVVIAGGAVAGGIAALLVTQSLLLAAVWAAVGAGLPVGCLLYRRDRRLKAFESQFPDSLDMMARAIRAGNSLNVALQLIGEEMPEPTGQEFRRVTEEIRLGSDAGAALARLAARLPIDDVVFFCSAVNIQRGSGGNLAELLDRLSEVIRERFKILSHARALSAQHRWAAICIGLFPLGFMVVFQVLQPGYFDPLLGHPMGPSMIAGGFVLETLGFLIIWRIARIKV